VTLDEQIADDEARARWFVVRRDRRGKLLWRWVETKTGEWYADNYLGGSYRDWAGNYKTRKQAVDALARVDRAGRSPKRSLVRMLPAGTRARRLERALRNLIAELPRCRVPGCSELATLGTVSHEPEACAEHWPQYIGGYHGRENGAALAAVEAQRLLRAAEKRRGR